MNFKVMTIALTIIIFAFGCGLNNKFRAAANTNENVSAATPAPIVSAAPTAAPSLKLDESNDPLDGLGKNYLAFGAGTLVIAKTSENTDDAFEGARAINNEGVHGGWQTKKGQLENQSIVLELPARTTLKTLVFDTFYGYKLQKCAKDIRVEVSDSPTDGFQTILTTTLRDSEDKQVFKVEREIAGRYVRYSALNNYGSPDYIFTKEIRGYGEQDSVPVLQNLSGTYKNKDYSSYGGLIHLKQEGSSIVGCYEGGNLWTFQGTVEGRVTTYEMKNKSNQLFSGTNVFAPDGKSFTELTWAGKQKVSDKLNFGEKISDKIGNCEAMPNLDGAEDTAKNQIEKNLADTGRAVLYGINFDFNSDVIKPESKPTLDKVTAIMKEKSDWKFSVEGHTDNVGGSAFNQTLSEKRAASVVKYLTDAGIDASRLSSAGFGLSKPVADNDSEIGRAQNRRVELVKQ